MPRYGKSAEDFNRESAALEAARKARQGVAAAEGQLTGALDSSSSALDRATAKTRLYNKAKQEQSAFENRQARANVEEASSIDVNTAAIERNAKARERASLAGRNLGAAFQGARDPMFARAAGMADPTTGVSQYELRRQLQIGQQRASRLQQAVGLGIQPGGPGVAHGPVTASQDADLAYSRAMAARRDALKRQDAAALQVADADLAVAKARRAELESVAKNAKAADTNTAAIAQDTAARERVASDPGQALIRHPQLYGRQAFAPISSPQTTTRPVTGELPTRYGGGNAAYDTKTDQAALSTQRLAEARQAQARADSLVLQQHVDEVMGRQATAADRAARATHASAVELGTASQQMTRHGALTSEFITAAQRGETTLREMANQAVITAGKFSAWTGAASAIYAAVGAVHELGQGAIDSSSGVNQLRRVVNDVNPDTAQKSFRDLAGQFNVPVADASDAVYRMGQVFHTQAEAVTAAKAALYSYKTGEVDVASSTQNLIAITRGFGLSSNDLLKVYDQINQAQNTFGIRIKDTEEGLAKAGGTFRNSGGDLNYLLGLFVAIQKATGRSGTEIGTGIARAANQIRKPSSQETLRGLGVEVDPNNLQATIQSALRVARRPGVDYNAIAAGLFGNQYARLIAPVLRDQTTLNKALKETSPEASKNSAQIELAKTLGQVDEQLKKVGVSLQRLGGALAQSGALDIFGLMLHLLNGMLTGAVDLVDAFDKLPEPLRTALSLAGEMYVMMRLIQRVAPGAPIIGSADAKQARLIQAGQTSAVQATIDEREAIARQARRATGTAERARAGITAFDADYLARQQAGTLDPEGSEERKALNRRRLALEEAAMRAEQRGVELELEADAARDQVVVAEREQARYKELQAAQGAKAVVAEAARQNLVRPGEFGLTSTGAVPVEGAPGGVLPGVGGGGPGAIEETPARAAGRLESASRQVTDRMRGLAETGLLAGRAATPVRAGIDKAAGALEGAAKGIAEVPGKLGQLKSGFRNLAASLGPLDYALIGLLAYTELKSEADKIQADLDKTTATLNQAPGSQAALQQQLRTRPTDPGSFGVHFATWVSNFAGIQTLQGKSTPLEDAQLQQQQKKLDNATEAMRQRLQARARAQGPDSAVPLQFLGQITEQIDSDSKLRNEGLISLGEFDKRMKRHAIEIQTAYNADPAGLKRARDQLATARRQAASGGSNYGAMFAGASSQELENDLAANLAVAGTFYGGQDKRVTGKLRANYDYLRQKLQFSNDPKEIQALVQARANFFKSIEDSANAVLQFQLADAHTGGERQAAYRRAADRMRSLPSDSRAQLKRDLDARAKAEQQVAQDQGLEGRFGDLPLVGGRIRSKLRSDTQRLKQLQRSVTKDGQEMADAYLEQKQQLQKIRDDAYSDRQNTRQIELAYHQSQTTDKSTQNADAVRSAAAQVRDAANTYGRNSIQWMQAMTELNNARNAAARSILDDVAAENALITARASGDPGSAARAAITTAQNTLDATRRDPTLKGHDRTNAIRNAQASLISAQVALSNFYRDQATAISQARFQLRESQVDDPVKRAQIEMEAARAAIKQATTEQDRIQARANYQDKRRALRDAKVQQTEDNIQWQLDMGKIDQNQAIAEYQALLKNHNLTKQMRRDIRLKIKQLQDSLNSDAQSFDLAVGQGVKLPTIYDVRRAISSVRQGGNRGTALQANNRITVNVEVNDPGAAHKVYDAIDMAMGTSIQSNLRQAGLSL